MCLGAAIVSVAVLAGCGKGGHEAAGSGGPARALAPVAEQGAVSVATRNTTRLGGANAAADAAAIARAVYPALTTATRPRLVVLVDEHDWGAALAASVLAGASAGAPILLADGNSLTELTSQTLAALHPIGLPALGGAQVLRIGTTAGLPAGMIARDLPAADPAHAAADIARLAAAAAAAHPGAAIVVPADAPQQRLMPAAGLAAESGAPILYVTGAGVPAVTEKTLKEFGRPAIFTLAQPWITPATLAQLKHLGHVTQMEGATPASDPVAAAIAIARFTDGTFGWGVKEPGHGLAFANMGRPLDAPAAAPLSAIADYAPLLLVPGPGPPLPQELTAYLSNIQPAYTSAPQFQPVRGVYNHGWLVGDESAISAITQAEIDALLEISPRGAQSPAEAAVAHSE
jgi:hypothetical protein